MGTNRRGPWFPPPGGRPPPQSRARGPPPPPPHPAAVVHETRHAAVREHWAARGCRGRRFHPRQRRGAAAAPRSEEHTSELQSLAYLVCRLLLERKKQHNKTTPNVCGHEPPQRL